MTIGKAYTAKRGHITLFGAVAGLLAIKATLRLASGREMIFRTAFAAGLGLERIPKPHEFAGNEGLGGDGTLDKHSCGANAISNGVCHALATERNYPAIVG